MGVDEVGGEEIFSCRTGLTVGDDFFCVKQHMCTGDLLPSFHQLASKCSGMIKEAGIYAFKLQVVKLK